MASFNSSHICFVLTSMRNEIEVELNVIYAHLKFQGDRSIRIP